MERMLQIAGVVLSGLAAFGCLAAALRRLCRADSQPQGTSPAPKSAQNTHHARPGRIRAIGALLRPGDSAALEDLRSRTTRAGLYARDAVDLFLSVRLALMVAGGAAMVVAVSASSSPLSALAAALAIGGPCVLGPGVWLQSRTRRRQAEVTARLPEMVDLLVLCLEAGLGLGQALRRVTRPAPGGRQDLLQSELHLVLADVERGVSQEQAFRRLAARVGTEEIKTLASVIAKGSALGSGIGGLLRDQAAAMRQRQLCELETISGKASAKLTLPLTICLLPAGMLLLVGPIFYSVFKQF